jgi:hypothetical protein
VHLEVGTRSLFGSMLDRLRTAQRTADFTLRGILWYQGEADAQPGLAETYLKRMMDWITAVRDHTGETELPVLLVQLGRVVRSPEFPPGTWHSTSWDAVREALGRLPTLIPNVKLTSAIDLGLADVIHIDTPGLQRLGRRLAKLATAQSPGPRVVQVQKGRDTPNGMPTVRVLCEGVVGRWGPSSNIRGFDIRTPDGDEHPTVAVVNAYPDPGDPSQIEIVLSGDEDGVRLGYGLGLDPDCSAVDVADMPLPAFAPRRLVRP